MITNKSSTEIILNSNQTIRLLPNQCRLCLMKVSPDSREITDILDQYQRLTGFIVHDFDIPRKICEDCQKMVLQFNDFYDQCSQTESLLEEIRQKQTVVHVIKEEEEPELEEMGEVEALEEDIDGTVAYEVVEYKVEEYHESPKKKLRDAKSTSKRMQKTYLGTPDFDALRGCLATNPQEAELFVLSFENVHKSNKKLADNQDGSYDKTGGDFSCSFCDYQSSRLNGLKWHFAQFHSDSGWFLCPICAWPFYNLDRMRMHVESTSGHHLLLPPFSPLKCDHCTFKTCKQSLMESHFINFHSTISRPTCECGSNFSCDDLKLQHILLQCEQCTKTCRLPYEKFLNGKPLDDRQSKVICELCGKSIAKKHVKYHKEIHHAKEYGLESVRFYCDLCSSSYKAKRELKLHMVKVHLKISSYSCNHCGRMFRNWNSRKYHVLTVHENDSIRHQCDVCGKKFASKFKMTEHRTMHSNIRKFQCELCEKTYKNLSMLREHKNTVHATSRQYPCAVCTKTFKDRKGLKQHTRTHADRQFKCPVCHSFFTVSHTLRNHMSTRHPNFPMPAIGTSLRGVDLSIYLPENEEHLTLEYLN